VFRQGDVGDRVYIVLRGSAEVVRENAEEKRVLATLRKGECFGEMALLRSTTRNATVRCLEPLDVLSLPKKEFTLLSDNLPELRTGFERLSEQRSTRESDRRIE
jgi:CRP-like cAMP-binding protein